MDMWMYGGGVLAGTGDHFLLARGALYVEGSALRGCWYRKGGKNQISLLETRRK